MLDNRVKFLFYICSGISSPLQKYCFLMLSLINRSAQRDEMITYFCRIDLRIFPVFCRMTPSSRVHDGQAVNCSQNVSRCHHCKSPEIQNNKYLNSGKQNISVTKKWLDCIPNFFFFLVIVIVVINVTYLFSPL